MSKHSKLYCGAVIAMGVAGMLGAAYGFHSDAFARLLVYILIAVNVATIKLRIPGLTATVSGGSCLIFAGLMELSSAETVVVAACVALVQCLWRPAHRPKPIQVVFSVATLVASVVLAWNVARILTSWLAPGNLLAMVACAAAIYFITNTMLLAGILALTEARPMRRVWNQLYVWTFPHYLLSAAMGGLFSYVSRGANWKVLFLFLPGACLAFGYARALGQRYAEQQSHTDGQ